MTPAAGPAIRAALKGRVPSDEQWAAIRHPLVPVHLIAGAGAGKTAVMAARMAWAIESEGYAPHQILGLTFTNKAAEELEDRVRAAVASLQGRPETAGAEITVQTYHAFAAAIVRDHGLLVGVEPGAGLLTEAQQYQLVLSCLDDLPPFEALELRSSAGVVRAALALSSALADHVLGTADVEAAADRILAARDADEAIRVAALRRRELCRAVEAYTHAKRRRQRIDFGDQVTKAVAILEGYPEVRAAYARRWPVILLDEYQDTNVAQRRLIAALFLEGCAVTAVGDARQAIYAFRGATMYNLIGFGDHFPRPDAVPYEPISLSRNFRSGSRILAAANHVVEPIPAERRPGAPLAADDDNGAGRVALGLFEDERAEARWIANECERVHGASLAPGRDPVAWRDIAVLVRRKSSMDPILEALEDCDIPVEVVGLGGLLKTPEVLEVVSWLRCLDTKPSSNRWMARVLLGPRWRIHYRDLALCARWAAGRNRDLRLKLAGGDQERALDMEPGDIGFALTESLDHLDDIAGLGPEARRRLAGFAARLAALRAKSSEPLLELVQEVVRVSGIGDALRASPSRSAAAARQNISGFMDHVAAFAPVEGDASLKSLLAYLDAAEDADETLEAMQPARGDSVKLMTVHAAKGLEFECVFVPKVAAGRNAKGDYVYSVFPDERSPNPLTNYKELPYEVREDARFLPRWTGKLSEFHDAVKERVREDERRLFYVALTRAKQHLAVTSAWWYGRDARPKGPSRLWDELAQLAPGIVDVVERAEQPAANPVIAELEARRAWPPPARAGADDPVFPDGWGAAADAVAAGDVSLSQVAESLDAAAAAELDALRRSHAAEIDLLAATGAGAPPAGARPPPGIIAATDYVALRRGLIEPVDLRRLAPVRPTSDRHLGVEIHRLIEQRTREPDAVGLESWPYPDESELDEPGPVEDRDWLAQRIAAWEELGFGSRRPARLPSGEPMIELPFALLEGDTIVRGRIDAVFETDDGGLEIVDYKSGRRFDAGGLDQLEIYARALHATGLVPDGARVWLTYAFLDGGAPVRRPWTVPDGPAPGDAVTRSLRP